MDPPQASTIAASPSRTALFEELFAAESPFVWHLLRRLGVPDRDLEDLAHEVFMTVYRRLDDYDRARPVRPWLYGIAVRTALRYRDLARHRREVMTEVPEPVDEASAAEDQVADREARRLLMKALDSIDLGQRAVFVLHEIEGWTMPEISEVLTIPLNTAYSRLRLARAGIKAALAHVRRGPT